MRWLVHPGLARCILTGRGRGAGWTALTHGACRVHIHTNASSSREPASEPTGRAEEGDIDDTGFESPQLPSQRLFGSVGVRGGHHHWLPERYRDWLDGIAHAWWRRGMLARLRKDHRTSGGGREDGILADIEARTEALMRKYGRDDDMPWLTPDGCDGGDDEVRESAPHHLSEAAIARDRSHVLSACRVLATHRALSSWIGDDDALLRMLREHNGAEASASSMLSGAVAAAMSLSRDPSALAVRMVRAVAYDQGQRGWAWRETGADGAEVDAKPPPPPWASDASDVKTNASPRAGGGNDVLLEMSTRRCLYHTLYALEGSPELAAATCCGVDGEVWFAHAGRFGLCVTRPEALSAGDEKCALRVERRPPDKVNAGA